MGQESNLQPAVLETAALPIELPTYGKRLVSAALPEYPTRPTESRQRRSDHSPTVAVSGPTTTVSAEVRSPLVASTSVILWVMVAV